jgi:Tfp pilus assembly protein PilF
MIETALKETPYNVRYNLYHARILMTNGDKANAELYFKKALDCYDATAGDKSLAYRSLAMMQENPISNLKKCIKADPLRREGYVLMSIYYFQKKRWGKAYKNAREALKITKKILDVATDNFAWGHLPYNLLAASRNNRNPFKKKLMMHPMSMLAMNLDLFGEVARQSKNIDVL